MFRRPQIVLNWLFTAIMIFVHILVKLLPLESYQSYPGLQGNLFLPADYSFGIWYFICILLIGFSIMSTRLLTDPGKAGSGQGKLAKQISPLFWLTCMLNSGWMLAWHYQQEAMGLLLLTALFGCLIRIFFYIQYSPAPLSYLEHVTLETPFVVYFGWITVLLMSNIASNLVIMRWQGGPLVPWVWCCILLGLATLIAVWLSKKRPAFSMVTVWAIVGIYAKQAADFPVTGYICLAACAVCIVASAIGFWYRRKVVFG